MLFRERQPIYNCGRQWGEKPRVVTDGVEEVGIEKE